MSIILKENETMEDVVRRLGFASEWVYEIAPIAYWYENLHENGRIKDIHFSRRMREMLGYKTVEEFPDELDTIMTFTHPDDVHVMLDDAIAAATGRIDKYDVQYRIRKADGSYLWCNATGQQIRNHEGVIIGMYGAFIDISREVELEHERIAGEELEQQRRALLNDVLEDDGVFLIDCVKDTRRTLHDRLSGAANYDDSENYSAAFARYVENFVCEPDREMMAKFINPAEMLEALGADREVKIRYRDRTTGTQRFYEMKIIRFSETEVLQSFRENDAETVNKLLFEKLEGNYFAIFAVDLESGLMRSYKDDPLHAIGKEGEVSTLSSVMLSLASRFDGETKAFFERNSYTKYIKARFAREDRAEYIYKSAYDKGKWVDVTGIVFTRNEDGSPSLFCYTFNYLDEEAGKLQDMQEQLKSALDEARSANKTIAEHERVAGKAEQIRKEHIARAAGTESTYIVNPRTERFQILSQNEHLSKNYSDDEDFDTSISRYIANDVFEPDREMVRKKITVPAIVAHLEEEDEYIVRYRDISKGAPHWFEMRAVRLSDDEILYGFSDRNREIILEYLQQKEYENYYALFSIDLDSEQITNIKNDSGYATGTVGSTAPYSVVMTAFANSLEGEAKDFFLKMSDIDKVKAIHAYENKLTYVYQSFFDEQKRWVRATAYCVIRHQDGTPAVVTLGFNLMDSMGAERQEMVEELARMTAVANYFVKSYSSAYYCDVRTGEVVILHANPVLMERIEGGEINFKNLLSMYVSDFVHPDDRDTVKLGLAEENVRQQLEEAEDFSFTFRAVFDDVPGIYRCTVIRGADGDHIGVGFKNVTEDIRKEQELEKIDSVVRSFASEYEAAFMVNLNDGSFQTVTSTEEIDGIFSGESSFMAALDRYTAEMMHPLDRERALNERVPLDRLVHELPVGQSHVVEYRCRTADGYSWYRGSMNRLSDELVMCGFKNINEEKLFRIVEEKIIGEFDAIYLVNLDRDEIRPVKASKVSSVGAFNRKLVYSEVCRSFAGTVAPKYAADWRLFGNVAFMKRYMGELNRREYIYELPEAGNSMRRLTADVLERVDGEVCTMLMTFTGIDDARAKTILLEKKMSEQNSITKYFLAPYDSAYYIGFSDYSCQVYKRSETMERKYPINGNYRDAFGRYIFSEVHPDDREAVSMLIIPNKMKEHLAEQESFSFVFRTDSITDERIIKCEVIRGADEDHAAFGFRDITKDVSRQRIEEQKLQNALDAAQSASKAKTDFLFNMSHDIRTPMNAILGFTNIARKNIDDRQKVLDCLAKTQQSGSLLLSLINSILDMSRIETGSAKLEEHPARITNSFENLDTVLLEQARSKDIDLSFEFGEIRDDYVFCDFDSFNRVFTNIISNALKYTKAGGQVKVRCEQDGEAKDGRGYYKYTVADNGIGMSEEFQQHVFEQFSRESNSTASGITGTGLGLAVVKSYVDLMGGTVSVESRQGEGTTFTVILPLRLQEGEKSAHRLDPKTGLPVSVGNAGEEKKLDFSGMRVLLVEDNEMNREIAEEILEEENLRIETAEDGSIAVEMLKEKGPDYYDFILMDIQMPIMNGYEATKAIRAMYPGAKLPIIAVSANAFAEDKAASFAAGMNDHVAKPININELFNALARFI